MLKKLFRALFISLIVVMLSGIGWLFCASFPLMGDIYISSQTKQYFNINNFYGDVGGGERIMTMPDEQDAYLRRLDLIEQAEHDIYFSCLYVQDQTYTSKLFISSLINAAERGVTVHILMNGQESQLNAAQRGVLMSHANINYYEYNRFSFFRPTSLLVRLHDKIFIVDNTYLIVGGRNMGDKYYYHENWDKTNHVFKDNEFLIYNYDNRDNSVIDESRKYFELFINNKHTKKLSTESNSRNLNEKQQLINFYNEETSNINFGIYNYAIETILTNKISLLHNSIDPTKKESVIFYNILELAKLSSNVVVQTPYIAMTNKNYQRLADAVNHTQNFVVLTNSIASNNTFPAYSNYYANRKKIVSKSDIQIYEYQHNKNALHTKLYLFDDRLSLIGSHNLDEVSIRGDSEMALVVDSPQFNEACYNTMTQYFDNSLKVDNKTNKYIANENVNEAKVSRWYRFKHAFVGNLLNFVRWKV